MTYALRALSPFGLEVRVPDGTPFDAIAPEQVHAWIAEHRVLVLRGLAPIEKRALPAAARRLGPLQSWEFGAVNELRPKEGTKNYLFTHGEVPLHWDGAFTSRVPRYLFFACREAPDRDAGGETVFVDTTRVWARADTATRDRWRALSFEYRTERVVHYGGRFTSEVVSRHPVSGEVVIRFAEPVDDLNPVSVSAVGVAPLESARCITELRDALSQPECVLLHAWEPGDVVIADNHALLHGRARFSREARRHIQRVNVHSAERSWLDDLRDSMIIRRPEFMVAEIPILLIAALLSVGRISDLATATFGLLTVLFFLLFHFGDMINCLADRELDAVYKTRLSEAVHGLGVRNVQTQIAVTVVLALGLSLWLAERTGRADIVALTLFGLALGAQYSLRPLWLKGRGLLQIATLWAVIFVGPMLLVIRTLGGDALSPLHLVLVAAYGAMQQGIVLVNTAEDLPEDAESGIFTSARALGLPGAIWGAAVLVACGGASVIAVMAHELALAERSLWGVAPLVCAWAWVLGEIVSAARAVGAAEPSRAVDVLRPRARRMPIWITVTAWGSLLAVLALRWGA